MIEKIISLFITIAGYIIGLGAVTVIDLHGFLGRNSSYWTHATIVTHKVTKPLIWLGTILVLIGSFLFYNLAGITSISYIHWLIFIILVFNGLFLSLWVSPRLLQREKENRSSELLPANWQKAISISFIVSFIGWWGSLALFSCYLISKMNI